MWLRCPFLLATGTLLLAPPPATALAQRDHERMPCPPPAMAPAPAMEMPAVMLDSPVPMPAMLAHYRQIGLHDRQIVEGVLLAQRLGLHPMWVLRRVVVGDPLSLIASDYQLPAQEARMVRQQARLMVAAMAPAGAGIALAPRAPPREAVAAAQIEVVPEEIGPEFGYRPGEWQRYRQMGLRERDLMMASFLARRAGLPPGVVAARMSRGDLIQVLAGDYGVRMGDVEADLRQHMARRPIIQPE